MAIEITPKQKLRTPAWATAILVVVLVLIAGLVASYLYLEAVTRGLVKSIGETETALKEIPTEEQKALEDELLLYEAKITNFGRLLAQHKETVNIFDFLEEVTHPRVWFSEFNFDSERQLITLSGGAESFVAVEQQILMLKEEPSLKNIILSEISMGEEGGIAFSLVLTIDPQIFE